MEHHAFGSTSLRRLATCHERLQEIMPIALAYSPFDITIVCGWRDQEAQDTAYRLGNSKLQWPHSKHNYFVTDPAGEDRVPMSLAVDAAPWVRMPDGKYGIPWDDERAFGVLAGLVIGFNNWFNAAYPNEPPLAIRWGGDWDLDGVTTDQTFMDLAHFEIVNLL